MVKTVTSIRIDEDLWKQAKHYAIDEGLSMTDLVERALKREMKQGSKRVEGK